MLPYRKVKKNQVVPFGCGLEIYFLGLTRDSFSLLAMAMATQLLLPQDEYTPTPTN
jgi:hypothetical protein